MRSFISLALFSVLVSVSAFSHNHHHRHHKRRISPAASTSLQDRAAPVLPQSWQYAGCYAEPSGGRALATKGPFPDGDQSMTQDKCVAHCNSQGFKFAGLEYMWECWCGNELNSPSTLSEAECNMNCSGDPTQKCGAGYKLSVFKKVGTSSNPGQFTDLGCYTDQEPRTLSGYSFEKPGGMTRDLCYSTCVSKGFPFAGVEYQYQCFCGSSISSSAKKVSSAECSMACPGNGAQSCGGGWRINVLGSGTGSGGDTGSSPSTYLGCYKDQETRTLGDRVVPSSAMTNANCFSTCKSMGFKYSGTEYMSECWCGNNLPASLKVTDGECNTGCSGKPSEMCGGSWRLSVYGPSGTTVPSDPTPTPTPTPSPGGGSTTGDWWTGSSSSSGKSVVAHFMMGNCYSYTSDTWTQQFQLAKAQGIDGFALNMGNDNYIAPQTAKAFAAASSVGFKLFFSFDVTAMGCSSQGHADNIRNYLSTYSNHGAYLKDGQGRAIVSTFSGEYCYFGRGSVDEGWRYAVKDGFNTRFIPSFFGDAVNFDRLFPCRDGDFYWNGGFPLGNYDINFNEDDYHLRFNSGRMYMTGVSPSFFTHYGADSWNKNWIFRGDNHVYSTRWEHLFQQRNRVDIVQIVSWNDYGESTYIGPIGQDQPNSQAWTTGFDHAGYLAMTGYWASAFKSGTLPTVTKDKIFVFSRPHSKSSGAISDGVGRPQNWEWTEDNIYITLFAKASAQLTVSTSSGSKTFDVNAGVNRVKVPMGANLSTSLARSGSTVFTFAPSGFQYQVNPSKYNYNYFSAHGP